MSRRSARFHRAVSARAQPLGLTLVLCLLLSAIQPCISLAESPLGDEPVGGVELELAWQMGGAITALDVLGDYAYLGIGPRLVIIDVSDPAQPVQVGQTDVLPSVETGEPDPYSKIWDISVVENTAYLAVVSEDDNLSLRLIDVRDPMDPQPTFVLAMSLYGIPVDGDSVQLCWAGDTLVLGATGESVFDYSCYLGLVNMVDGQPQLAGSLKPRWITRLSHLSCQNSRLRVLGSFDYSFDSSLNTYEIPVTPESTPETRNICFTALLGPAGDGARRLLVADAGTALTASDRLYCVEPEATIQPCDPAAVPSCKLSDTPTRDATLALQGQYAAVLSESELMMVDLRDMLHPAVVGRTAVGGLCVVVSGDYAYVAAPDGLHIVDISDPHQPRLAGTWTYSSLARASHLEVLSPDRLLVSVGSQLLALDTPADAAPILIAGLDVRAPINDFCLVEDGYCDLMLATSGLGLIPVSLDGEGMPALIQGEPLEPCDANYIGIIQTTWEQERYDGMYETERQVLAMTDGHALAYNVSTGRQQCSPPSVSVSEGFSLDQVVGQYAYVGRTIFGGEMGCPQSGQIEVYDLSHIWDGPRVAAVIATDRPVGTIVPHGGYLYVDGQNHSVVSCMTASTLLRIFDIADPAAPVQIHGTIFGECETAIVRLVSDNYLAANTTRVLCATGNYGNAYCGSSMTLFRVNEGPDLQLVSDRPCARFTTPLAFSDDLLIGTHPIYGLFAWRIRPLPAWGTFFEGESCGPHDPDYRPVELPQAIGTDMRASNCEYMEGGTVGFTSSVPHDGDYYLWARLRDSDPEPDSFSLRSGLYPLDSVRGFSEDPFDGTTSGEGWEWKRVGKLDDSCQPAWNDGERWLIPLSAVIFMHHPGAAIDCLYLTDSPSAIAPMITPCVPAGLVLLPIISR